ncbi:phage terminase small subunit [Streptococcus koreensis]|uniref:phage terminase small subunit n=1 Tax=Streptococcus koreensis TaxID=2382163 RepID=UPI0022E445FE|nr:phage terminase small subunit [Streptococcus koreensis]
MGNSELAKKDYQAGMKYKDIASKYDVSINTVKSWQRRHGWTRNKKGAPKKPRGAPVGNKNAVGHGAPKGNSNAVTHGLRRRYLPEGISELIDEVEAMSPIDILWENITLAYANLLHAQRILFVTDVKDTTSLVASTAKGGIAYEHHTAWDKQSKALSAIARAQSELTRMMKTYDELTRSPLATEEQRLRIDNLKAQLGSNDEGDTVITGFTFDRSEHNGNTEPSQTD